MPSTTTTQFGVTGRQIIESALKRLRVLSEGQTANAAQITDGLFRLNLILKSIGTDGVKLWCYTHVQVPLVTGQREYTIGPVGADVTSPRPLLVVENGSFWRQTIGGLPYDTPLRVISRAEYAQFGSKASSGAPNSVYYSPTLDTSAPGTPTAPTGFGRLYVYLPSAATVLGVLHLNATRYIFDMNADTDTVDMPAEGFFALEYALAAHWGDEFEVPEDRLGRYITLSNNYMKVFEDSNVEQAATTFAPDMTPSAYEETRQY